MGSYEWSRTYRQSRWVGSQEDLVRLIKFCCEAPINARDNENNHLARNNVMLRLRNKNGSEEKLDVNSENIADFIHPSDLREISIKAADSKDPTDRSIFNIELAFNWGVEFSIHTGDRQWGIDTYDQLTKKLSENKPIWSLFVSPLFLGVLFFFIVISVQQFVILRNPSISASYRPLISVIGGIIIFLLILCSSFIFPRLDISTPAKKTRSNRALYVIGLFITSVALPLIEPFIVNFLHL